MAEYIELDKALNVCEMHYKHCISMQDWRGDTIAWNIGADIKTIPAADVVEVKHGTWQHIGLGLKCSECGLFICIGSFDKRTLELHASARHYCEKCGAKMNGGKMHNEHLEKRIAELDKKQYVDPLIEETKRIMREHKQKHQKVKNKYITVGQAQRIIKNFFCECIEKGIMEVDVVDANAELCRRIEKAELYTESRGKNGKV